MLLSEVLLYWCLIGLPALSLLIWVGSGMIPYVQADLALLGATAYLSSALLLSATLGPELLQSDVLNLAMFVKVLVVTGLLYLGLFSLQLGLLRE